MFGHESLLATSDVAFSLYFFFPWVFKEKQLPLWWHLICQNSASGSFLWLCYKLQKLRSTLDPLKDVAVQQCWQETCGCVGIWKLLKKRQKSEQKKWTNKKKPSSLGGWKYCIIGGGNIINELRFFAFLKLIFKFQCRFSRVAVSLNSKHDLLQGHGRRKGNAEIVPWVCIPWAVVEFIPLAVVLRLGSGPLFCVPPSSLRRCDPPQGWTPPQSWLRDHWKNRSGFVTNV